MSVPHCPELNELGDIGCICYDCVIKRTGRIAKEEPVMDEFMRMYWLRRGGDVKRWHTEKGFDQTVGQHSFNVALILVQTLKQACSVNLLRAALCHDLGEKFIGDIPAPVKWGLSDFCRCLELQEQEAKNYLGVDFNLTFDESWLLKNADFLDACWECLDQIMMGNQFAKDILARLHRHQERESFWADTRLQILYNNIYFEAAANGDTLLKKIEETHYWNEANRVKS